MIWKPYKIFLVASLVLAMLIYVVIFGDSGYIMHGRLKAELQQIKHNIAELKEENKVLNERYYMLGDNSRSLNMSASQYYFLSPEATIIKIDESDAVARKKVRGGPYLEESLSILELRAFFLVGWIFLMLIGVAIINQFMQGVSLAEQDQIKEMLNESN